MLRNQTRSSQEGNIIAEIHTHTHIAGLSQVTRCQLFTTLKQQLPVCRDTAKLVSDRPGTSAPNFLKKNASSLAGYLRIELTGFVHL